MTLFKPKTAVFNNGFKLKPLEGSHVPAVPGKPAATNANAAVLSASGFRRVNQEMSQFDCAIVSVMGDTGTGKTHWALNAPGPIAYFDFDRGLHRALREFAAKDKEIYVQPYMIPPNLTEDCQPQCESLCSKMQKDFRLAITPSTKIKTVVFDTGSDVWELIRLAKLGKLAQVPPIRYQICNSIMSGLISRCREAKVNLILIHKQKAEYQGNNPTGKMIRHGWSETGYQVDAEIILSRNRKAKMFEAEYVKAAANPDLVGEKFEGQAASFPQMMARMFQQPVESWTDPVTGIIEKLDPEPEPEKRKFSGLRRNAV